jgi:hypothetical protein
VAISQRKPPPADQAARIVAAMQGMADALIERDQAITDALKAGASVREVALVSGMSTRTIQTIGHDNGWPTPAQKKRREEEAATREGWNDFFKTYQRP